MRFIAFPRFLQSIKTVEDILRSVSVAMLSPGCSTRHAQRAQRGLGHTMRCAEDQQVAWSNGVCVAIRERVNGGGWVVRTLYIIIKFGINQLVVLSVWKHTIQSNRPMSTCLIENTMCRRGWGPGTAWVSEHGKRERNSDHGLSSIYSPSYK